MPPAPRNAKASPACWRSIPDRSRPINAAFTPSAEDVAHAKKVVAAFAGGAGVASLDGKMLDQPHLKQAEHILALAQSRSPHAALALSAQR